VRLLALFLLPLIVHGADPKEFFESRIRPLLVKNCFACHTQTRMGGLEMTSREALLKGGASGPVITPGDPDGSVLIQAVRHTHARLKMPPAGRLAEQEISDLAAWIKDGAVWGDPAAIPKGEKYVITPEQRSFWAFRAIRKPQPPAVRNLSWTRTPIDRFILAKLDERGLAPMAPASKRVLIRRATLDLTGLPPTLEEVDSFLKDSSPQAFAKVIDRLLASPHYGERWGKYWLDVARYSDDKLDSTGETPHPNAFRYRDWVIQAFNEDMPYDIFVKAQIAGDLFGGKHAAGAGMYALSPEQQDDRVDVTTRGFMGLTVACAQCHDHKYDPIPTRDYYSLLGIFNSSTYHELPLAPADVVAAYDAHKKKIEEKEKELKQFVESQAAQLAAILASRASAYMLAAAGRSSAEVDKPTLERWQAYLKLPQKEHPFLKTWDEAVARSAPTAELEKSAREFQSLLLAVNDEKKQIDEKNLIRLGGSMERRVLTNADLLSLARDKYFLWRDFFSGERFGQSRIESVLHYGDPKIDRWLSGEWKSHLERLRSELAELKRTLPPQYPFLHTLKDAPKPTVQRVLIRGARDNPGEIAPRRFLQVLSDGEPREFTNGSGRLELAESIANPNNPLTARVIVNRVWMHHFGQGIVRTPSNFGQLGDRPSHPELLDYLAARLVEQKWSLNALHREIMLSAVYQLSASNSGKNNAADPDNRLLWRAARRRLDVEALRDSMLFVSGNLDAVLGGPPIRLTEEKNVRRTVYGYVSRKKLDTLLAIFDHPNPNSTSEQRIITNVPLQRLFLLNSSFVMRQAEALAARVSTAGDDTARIRCAYGLAFGREPSKAELALGVDFLAAGDKTWPQYAQVLLASNEFLFVD
jgi:hypothetical protein